VPCQWDTPQAAFPPSARTAAGERDERRHDGARQRGNRCLLRGYRAPVPCERHEAKVVRRQQQGLCGRRSG